MPSEEASKKATDDLRRALRQGLTAYRRFRSGELSFGEYVKEHGSFFYEWDLDGNESGEAWKQALGSSREAVDLLRRLQETLDLVYMSNVSVAAHDEVGRLTPARAVEALMRLTPESGIDALLRRLDEGPDDG